ncbi:glutamate--cysteine ligase [Glaciibacter flavus]|uniref:Putative glutamate--cysteine ligase 2 n=1 Tax=Orlajensenia flava TaxID=2565934 RepID=A0A4S4FW11_9MICO|nr:glutamate--cysteine ligase [Glaciibacter flavus]THG34973.1 glutamate--cysteine ligase [Glaciibacter flavus]
MHISFARSDRSSVGIEWELELVDRTTGELSPIADDVLRAMADEDGEEHPHATHELMLNTVEIVSGVHDRVGGAVGELLGIVEEVRDAAAPLGADVMCSGSHPFSQWYDQKITDKERYHRLIERTQWWGRNMMIWGVHVHVGIEEQAKAIPIHNALLGYLPHLQALSASSPFWAGVDTGYASNRALVFQQLPTAGLPWQYEDWAAYEAYVEDMTRTGVITDYTEVRSDVRPSPHWGTLEVRSCDGVSTGLELGALAALIQCLVDWMSERMDDGETLPWLQPWYVRENKWRAARYGLDAEVILDSSGREALVTDDLRELVEMLQPVAERLGCATELAQVLEILDIGGSYQRQLAVAAAADGDLTQVVAHLVREMHEGRPLRP